MVNAIFIGSQAALLFVLVTFVAASLYYIFWLKHYEPLNIVLVIWMLHRCLILGATLLVTTNLITITTNFMALWEGLLALHEAGTLLGIMIGVYNYGLPKREL